MSPIVLPYMIPCITPLRSLEYSSCRLNSPCQSTDLYVPGPSGVSPRISTVLKKVSTEVIAAFSARLLVIGQGLHGKDSEAHLSFIGARQ